MIAVQLNQLLLQGGQKYPRALLTRVLAVVERAVGKRPYEVSIAFVSAKQMQDANKRYRGKNRVTDVLSFGLSEHEGELLLCYPQAKLQAKQMHHSVRAELTFLIVHGMLHLFGHDHEKPSEAKKMFDLQTTILKKLQVNPRLFYDESP